MKGVRVAGMWCAAGGVPLVRVCVSVCSAACMCMCVSVEDEYGYVQHLNAALS